MNYLALLGWAPSGGDKEIFTKEELIKEFDLKRVTPSPAIFDFQKLYWINRQYIKRRFGNQGESVKDSSIFVSYSWADEADVRARIEKLAELTVKHPKVNAAINALSPFIYKQWLDFDVIRKDDEFRWFQQLLTVFAPYADRLDQVADQAAPVFMYDADAFVSSPSNAEVLSATTTPTVIEGFARQIVTESALDAEIFKAIMNQIKTQTGIKGKDLFHPVRVMLIGSHSGPDFDKLIPVIEAGSKLDLPVHIKSVRERVKEFMAAFEGRP